VTSTAVEFPETNGLITSIDRVTRKDENVYLDALGLAETLFDDHMAANMIVLGAAWQAGAIPVSAAAIEEAIALNGVSVQMNSHAFRVGRLVVADPAWVRGVTRRRLGAAVDGAQELSAEARQLVDGAGATGELRRLLVVRAGLRRARRNEVAARHPARPVRFRRGAAPGAAAPRRVSRGRRKGAGRALAGELRTCGEARGTARPDPWLRRDQAPQRPALP